MFAALGRRTALHAARRTAQQQAKRRMGGGAAAAPEWTGIDKVVRGYFPKDEDSELYNFSCVADMPMNTSWSFMAAGGEMNWMVIGYSH